jgi:hypothetical protein
MSEPELDPRWDWVAISSFDKPGPTYIKGRCRHTEVEPVTSLTGEEVAQLCLTCDSQLPPSKGTARFAVY